MAEFSEEFLDRLGFQRLSPEESARAGKMPDVLTCEEIARIMVPMSGPGYYDYDRGEHFKTVKQALTDACRRGILKGRMLAGSDNAPAHMLGEVYFIHRDDARRYFAALDLMPTNDSPLSLWLKGPAAAARAETLSAQDMADFQQMCVEQWRRNPTQTITGPNGVVQTVGKSYLVSYKLATLEKWARAVAPDGVKGVRGRRKKSAPE